MAKQKLPPLLLPPATADLRGRRDTRKARQERKLLTPPTGTPRQTAPEVQLGGPAPVPVPAPSAPKEVVAPTSTAPTKPPVFATQEEEKEEGEGTFEQEILGILGKPKAKLNILGIDRDIDPIRTDNETFLLKMAGRAKELGYKSLFDLEKGIDAEGAAGADKARLQTLLKTKPLVDRSILTKAEQERIAQEEKAKEAPDKAPKRDKSIYDKQINPYIDPYIRTGDNAVDMKNITNLQKYWTDWLQGTPEPLAPVGLVVEDGKWKRADGTPASPEEEELALAYENAGHLYKINKSLAEGQLSMLQEEQKLINDLAMNEADRRDVDIKKATEAEIRALDLEEKRSKLPQKQFAFQVIMSFLSSPSFLSSLASNPSLLSMLQGLTGVDLSQLASFRRPEAEVRQRLQAIIQESRGKLTESQMFARIKKLADDSFWSYEDLIAMMQNTTAGASTLRHAESGGI